MFAVAIGALLAIGGLTEAICVRRDRHRFPPPGRVVNGLHLRQMGGDVPAVVLEAGIAASCLNWSLVQSDLTRPPSVRSYSYDRPGFGWSARFDGDCSVRRLTDDLHALILALDVPRPFVLAGHSFGTYVARVYAHRFSEEVAGLLLVDPVTPEEWMDPSDAQRWRLRRAVLFAHVARVLAAVGVARLGLWALLRRGHGNPGPVLGLSETLRRMAGELVKLPVDLTAPLRARWSEPHFFRVLAAYLQAMPASAKEAARHPIPPGMPVTVLSGAHQPLDRLAEHRSVATRHIIVEGSAHWIHFDHPELVAQAIRDMVRSHRRFP